MEVIHNGCQYIDIDLLDDYKIVLLFDAWIMDRKINIPV